MSAIIKARKRTLFWRRYGMYLTAIALGAVVGSILAISFFATLK